MGSPPFESRGHRDFEERGVRKNYAFGDQNREKHKSKISEARRTKNRQKKFWKSKIFGNNSRRWRRKRVATRHERLTAKRRRRRSTSESKESRGPERNISLATPRRGVPTRPPPHHRRPTQDWRPKDFPSRIRGPDAHIAQFTVRLVRA